ncbi:asparaginase [Streptosporangium saharense]|uniref:asparaginase n=1 Tax=Streptosporangium saharense TaxID=1706840 RepID=UPI0033240CB7
MSRVIVLTTGGTIASRHGKDAVTAGTTPADLLAGLDVEHREIFDRGSYGFGEAELRLIARTAVAAADEADGVVVTHGTDTMEETAFLTALTHTGDRPIVFCGAQRPADDPDRDGPRNLRDAVRLAAHPEAAGLGVMIAMGGRAWSARHATKTHTLDLGAFSAPDTGPLATLMADDVQVVARPVRHDGLPLAVLDEPLPRVDLVTAHAGADGALIRAAVAGGARGVVVAALGTGNVPPDMATAIEEAMASGVTVVVVSRCPAGPVVPRYGGHGGGAGLAASGVVFGGSLRPSHARLLLAVTLAVPGRVF